MTEIILHHYDASPFTQRAIKMLAIKGLAWRSVIQPMILPKDELIVLTGGYRGTPVMQIGADIYIDSQRIAVELEDRYPEPSLFPNGNRGMPLALVFWGDAFFAAGLHMAIHELSDDWGETFMKDRKALFSNLDFEAVKRDFPDACARLRAHASLVEAQLCDGRAFLQGDRPGMADIQAFSVPWFTLASMAVARELLKPFPHLLAWNERMAGLGEGERTEIEIEEAYREAKSADPLEPAGVDADDPLGLKAGDPVEIRPVEAERGAVRGELVTLKPNAVAIRRRHDKIGDVVVHFPRLGYRVSAVQDLDAR
ncbi:MAG: glutathione S-transferase family protein [Alphaproteobacteria bacterium]|nr:MAG: glutathione S-transferase family protein [Alphaproteobacteria bacterium]